MKDMAAGWKEGTGTGGGDTGDGRPGRGAVGTQRTNDGDWHEMRQDERPTCLQERCWRKGQCRKTRLLGGSGRGGGGNNEVGAANTVVPTCPPHHHLVVATSVSVILLPPPAYTCHGPSLAKGACVAHVYGKTVVLGN